MAELRWILLGAGTALIIGLWRWETRKSRARGAGDYSEPGPGVRAAGEAAGDAPPDVEADAPMTYAPTIERVRVPRRPPLIEIPDDLEVDVYDFVGMDRRHAVEPAFSREADAREEPEVSDAANEEASFQEVFADENEQPDDYHRAPWIRTHPLDRDEVAPDHVEELPAPPPADAMERRTAEASRQRIVALRLVASGGGWSGAELRAALEAEGLAHGPYSIFHREREDGKSLFYVASMMEPGSFDPVRMDDQEFPGVSIFGVVPGPLDAPSTFDLVLSAGRILAERLAGQLQDEQGSTLTAQRILNLREELVHFEHRNRRLRRT